LRWLLRDASFAAAALRRQPGFAAVVVTTLALGIGVNTALFSVVDAVLLRPLPFREPDRLAALWETTPRKARVAPANYLDWRRESRAFESMAAFGAAGFTLTGAGAGEAERVEGAVVDAEYFEVLGVAPSLGRTFTARDAEPGAASAILGHELWRRRFAGDPGVIGRSVLLDGTAYDVVGVAPPGLYPSWPSASGRISFSRRSQQVFVAMRWDERRAANRNSHVLGVVGRLRKDVDLEAGRREMSVLGQRLAALHPESNQGDGILVTSLESEIVGDVRPALTVLLAAVGLVLVLACANVASLLLARASARERELAVRRALGASRARVVGLVLAESLLLALIGGALGCGLAAFGVELLRAALPAEVPRLADIAVDGRVLAFALGVSLATGLAFGLGPALHASRGDTARGLHEGLRGTAGPRRLRARQGLVVAQVALALVLTTAGALLVRSFDQLRRVDPGFAPDGVLAFDLLLPPRYSGMSQVSGAYDALLDRLRGLPGVEVAALAYDSPLESNWIDVFSIEGRPEPPEGRSARLAIVGPGYFEALRIGLRAGRALDGRDVAGAAGALVVSESFAARFLPGEDPLGRWLSVGTPRVIWGAEVPSRFQIVGVAADVRSQGIGNRPEPTYYLAAAQFPQSDMSVLLRARGEPLALLSAAREEVARFDPDLAIGNPTTLSSALAAGVAQPRFNMIVLGGFGCLALGLAGIGLYGLLSYSVARRTREMGIRLALGAWPRRLEALVVREGLVLIAAGGALGLCGAFAAGRLMSALLYGVGPSDLPSFGAGLGVLSLAGLLASYLPARRAAAVAPASALRAE
jgi:predicted permease